MIVVCHTGIGTANFLAERLNTYFHIRIMAVTSNHRLADVMKNYDFDVIHIHHHPEGTGRFVDKGVPDAGG